MTPVSPRARELVEDEKPVEIIVSVELSNGHFKSSLRQPLDAPLEDKKAFVEKWFALIQFGLQTGATSIDADFDKDKP